MRPITFALTILAFGAIAQAEIVDSAANGFTVKTTVTIASPPDNVYRRIVHNVGDWWSPQHTFSSDSYNLSIEEKAGGCFCEKMPDGGVVRHLEVAYFSPNKVLVMRGALGPMQALGATGALTIQLTPSGQSTKLDVTYAVGGYLAKGMNTWAAPVDMVLAEQFTRLKNYIEHGNPVVKEEKK